jgi:probable HAF family extracellular repeat protein
VFSAILRFRQRTISHQHLNAARIFESPGGYVRSAILSNLFVSVLFVAAAAAVSVPSVTYHQIKVPGAVTTEAIGVNNNSQIVGSYQTSSAGYGFLLSNGQYQQLAFPGGQFTSANAINDSGEIVGNFTDQNNDVQGFVLSNGTYRQLSYPGYTYTSATGVNDSGVIVGNFWDSSSESKGFKYENGNYTEVAVPGATYTDIGGINKNGDISGSYFIGTKGYGYILHSNGKMETVSYPGATGETGVGGINDKDQVVGDYSPNGTETIDGFADGNGTFVRLAYPGATQTFPVKLQ